MSIYTPPYTFTPGERAQSGQVDANFTAAATVINGQLDTNNLSASANIVGSQLSASANILGSQLSASAGITQGQLDSSVGVVLYGTIIAWWTADAVPSGWALCNGQTTTWVTGPHAGGSVTLPNLIGMFIQGADITGGSSAPNGSGFGSQTNQSIVGSKTHLHAISLTSAGNSAAISIASSAGPTSLATNPHTHAVTGNTAATNTQPPSYAIVYIMRL